MHSAVECRTAHESEEVVNFPEFAKMDLKRQMAYVASDIDPENIEQMKETKKEIEKKVAKILKLVKNNGQDKKGKIPEDSKKKSELIGLIEEFHRQYRSLYAQCDHLRGELVKARDRNKQDSASSSDSEYYSPQELDNGHLMKEADNTKGEIKTEDLTAEKKHKVSYKKVNKEVLDLDYVTGKDEKKKLDEPNREGSALVKVHESHGSRASAQIKELEGQLTVMKIELESLRAMKKDLKTALENNATEAKQLGEKNKDLRIRISELELMSKERGDEISGILKKLKDNDIRMTSRNKELTAQVNSLQWEVHSLRMQKGKLEGSKRNEISEQIKGLKYQINAMQQEIDSLQSQKTELESQVNMKTKEVTENIAQIETLKDEIARKTASEKGLLKEREDLKQEMQSLCDKKTKLEDLLGGRNQETDQLREENERMKQESTRIRTQLEDKILKLTTKVVDQERILKERESSINKFFEEQKLLKSHSMPTDSPKYRSMDSPKQRSIDSSKVNHQSLERKIEELAEKFHMKMENHIRLLLRRILVAEQIQVETKDCYKKQKERLEQENKEISENMRTFEAELGKMSNVMLERGTKALSGLDSELRKIDEGNGYFLKMISRVSDELQAATNWITETNNEKKQLQDKVESLTSKLVEKEANSEAKLPTMIESDQLEQKVEDLEQIIKEKDEMMIGLGEEKREAIRQLCVLIDYHRSRYDDLKEAISKVNVRARRATTA